MSVDPVARWQDQLRKQVGMTDPERNRLRAGLDAYCVQHGVTPEQLLAQWQTHPELTVRRRPKASESPNLAVESFLVHNGINVFGEIVCVAARPEDLARQGPWFTARVTSQARAAPSAARRLEQPRKEG